MSGDFPPDAQYGLNKAGVLKYFHDGGAREMPDLVKRWHCDWISKSPLHFFAFLVEAQARGANTVHIMDLYQSQELGRYIDGGGEILGIEG